MKHYIMPAILLVISLPVLMCGCGEKISGKMASPQTEQSKSEKLLDKALELSGKKFTPEERNVALRMFRLNEKDIIQGLTVFLELSDGRYPSKLDAKTTLTEAEALWRAKHGEISPDETTGKKKKKEAKEAIYDIFFATAFYDKLVREKKGIAYYGDKVKPGDSNGVVVRWEQSRGKYRVIFGDLRIETVSKDKLAELEKGI